MIHFDRADQQHLYHQPIEPDAGARRWLP